MSELGPAAVELGGYRHEGFDPAASAGLFVGISTFEDARFHAVQFAVDDAVDLAHLFALELGLVEPGRCVLALAGKTRKKETKEGLTRLLASGARRVTARQRDLLLYLRGQAREAGPQGLFLLGVASHGVSDQGGDFLVATDSLAEDTLLTGVPVNVVLDVVAQARAPRRLVLLDACRERLTAGTRGESGASMAPSFADAIAKAQGQVVLAGATVGGFAYDDEERGNGVFTAAVLDGLRGAAAADERGWITARTLADFVQQRVVEWVEANRREHAVKSLGIGRTIEGPGDLLPLAVNPERSRALAAYKARRAAALVRLKDNLGPLLKGADYDYVEARLPEKEPTPAAVRLLDEIETLDGTARMQRSLRDFLREQQDERAAPPLDPPARKPTIPPAVTVAAAAIASGVLVAVTLWLSMRGNEEPKQLAVEPAAVSPPPLREPPAGSVWEGPFGMRFRFIPAGTYTIGSPASERGRWANETERPVQLTRGFWLGETEVTQAQWGKLVPKNPSRFSACGGDCPVEQVSWFEAAMYANLISRQTGLAECYELEGCKGTLGQADFTCASARFTGLSCAGYRLPTEAEWEVAARAGTQTPLYTGGLTFVGMYNGPELDPIAWYGGNSGVSYAGDSDCSRWREKQYPKQRLCGTHQVGKKAANAWGLRDMLGNVWEWVGDWQAAYPSSLAVDPLGSSVDLGRVLRGGSWIDWVGDVRTAARRWDSPGFRVDRVGFRLARGQGAL